MQSSPNAMHQAANLFVFTMNNPVMWRDPLGLFATTSDLFNLDKDDIRRLGGSFGVNSSGNVSTITFDGTTFRTDGTYQVNGGSRHNVSSQGSDFITNTILRGGPEMILLGGHRAFDRFNAFHLHITMFASPASEFYLKFYGWDSAFTILGLRYAFLSGTGTPGFRGIRPGMFSESTINNINYHNRANLQFIHHIHSGVGMVEALYFAHNHFMSYHNRSFPWNAGWTNSTSITLGLLGAVGLDHQLTAEQQRRAAGINRTIPPRYFGR